MTTGKTLIRKAVIGALGTLAAAAFTAGTRCLADALRHPRNGPGPDCGAETDGGFRCRLEKRFEAFTEGYDLSDERISGKKEHTIRVAENALEIAGRLGLDARGTDIAFAAAVLHDLGRFEQAARYGTFLDREMDHAAFGADYLFREGHISSFITPEDGFSDEDLAVIEKAVRLHNLHVLPDGLTGRERCFCTLLRDADKIDIFRFCALQSFEICHEYSREAVSASRPTAEVIDSFREKRTVYFPKRQTPADIFLSHIALCFGVELPCSREILSSRGDIWKMADITFDDPCVQSLYAWMLESVKEYLHSGEA